MVVVGNQGRGLLATHEIFAYSRWTVYDTHSEGISVNTVT
jgi:hypothetical protein